MVPVPDPDIDSPVGNLAIRLIYGSTWPHAGNIDAVSVFPGGTGRRLWRRGAWCRPLRESLRGMRLRRGRSSRGAAALLAAMADPGRGFDAIVVGEYERAFYGSQYALMAPLFEHYGVQLWLPEAGGPADFRDERHEEAIVEMSSRPGAARSAGPTAARRVARLVDGGHGGPRGFEHGRRGGGVRMGPRGRGLLAPGDLGVQLAGHLR
jgi:hypothetical protein